MPRPLVNNYAVAVLEKGGLDRKKYEIELLTQIVAHDCHDALGVKVSVNGKFILNIGQTVICECESECTHGVKSISNSTYSSMKE